MVAWTCRNVLYFRNFYETLTQNKGANHYEACLITGNAMLSITLQNGLQTFCNSFFFFLDKRFIFSFCLSILKWANKYSPSCEITTGSLFWTIIYCKSYYFTWTIRLSYLNATVPNFHFTTNTCACDWWCPCYWLRRKWFEIKQKPNDFINVHVHTLYYSVRCAWVFSMIYSF